MQDLWLLLKYIFLGLFQGFTEPIPISSSGHLVILQKIINIGNDGFDFLILVNFGSLIAVIMIYRSDITSIAKNSISFLSSKSKSPENKDSFDLVLYLVIGTIPAGIIGLIYGDFIEAELGGILTVGVGLIVTGIFLWIIRNKKGTKNDRQLTWKDAIIVGLAQSVSLIPGISRSGATVVASMLSGMERETALRFSFFLYIPVSLGTMLLSIDTLVEKNISEVWIPYTLALLASIIASYFSLKLFINVMEKGKLKYFSFYCLVVGVLVLLFLL
ncbi:UDP pyrophosphate phosphatase [Virgibacillus sp. NKC19-16]|uniref:undecaprenyl-diphosphate phosphatase n=1 Tax=Virgibacillus salidurans TaxID=2831673 RepID=UPI001F16956E|nr:undecaprenyl-diphosphate phosphatase [Virgibacillus sp. NKC19-16]UJL47104.1 UDP pyrophosphate phosphatase [Virgibacillus sp. NKC19-16]